MACPSVPCGTELPRLEGRTLTSSCRTAVESTDGDYASSHAMASVFCGSRLGLDCTVGALAQNILHRYLSPRLLGIDGRETRRSVTRLVRSDCPPPRPTRRSRTSRGPPAGRCHEHPSDEVTSTIRDTSNTLRRGVRPSDSYHSSSPHEDASEIGAQDGSIAANKTTSRPVHRSERHARSGAGEYISESAGVTHD